MRDGRTVLRTSGIAVLILYLLLTAQEKMVSFSLTSGRAGGQTELRIQLPPPFSGEKPTPLTRLSEPKLDFFFYIFLPTVL